jgi:hypothetical protein
MASDYEMAGALLNEQERQFEKVIAVFIRNIQFLRDTCDKLFDSHTKQCVDREYCRTCIVMGEAFPDEYGIDND